MDGDPCLACDIVLDDSHMAYGLPVYEGVIVPNSWDGPWVGMDACWECSLQQERLQRPVSLAAFRAAGQRFREGKGYGDAYARC